MTAITDCHCGNCPKYSTKIHPIGASEIHFCNGKRMPMHTYDCTKHIGCMLHPKAREVLMKDVLKELEALEAKSTSNDIVACGYRTGLYKAISLIRGGDGE